MRPLKHALLATCLLLAPAALSHADPAQTLEVTFTYDAGSLNTAEGTDRTLSSLMEQAHSACKYKAPVSSAPRSDAACERAVLDSAIASISNGSLNGAYRMATQSAHPHLTAKNDSKITNE